MPVQDTQPGSGRRRRRPLALISGVVLLAAVAGVLPLGFTSLLDGDEESRLCLATDHPAAMALEADLGRTGSSPAAGSGSAAPPPGR